MTSLNLSLGPLLHDAARLIRRRFEQHTADLGLSSAQWRLLIHVLKEERVTQARLAERLEIEPISVSRLIDRMVQAGWVMRETDPNDRRVRLIVASPRALSIRESLFQTARGVYAEALAGIPSQDQAALIDMLQTLTTNLSEAIATGCKDPK
jgi:MarR family transcriptional regulator, transcriptional regulator for hemolysin